MTIPLPFLYFFLLFVTGINKVDKSAIKGNSSVKTVAEPILWTIDWSADNKLFAVGGNDGLLRIYEPTGCRLLRSYNLPGAVQCLDWNPNANILAVALDDHPVQLLNINTGVFSKLQGTTGSRALAWSSNGEMLANGDYSSDLQVWSRQGKLLKSIRKENTKTILSVDWHPRKNTILTGSDKIRVFDTSGNVLQNIKHRPEETILLSVKWHPDGTFFATGDYGHKEEGIGSLLQFWKEDGTLEKSLSGSNAEYRNIRWNKDGTLLATASDGLRLWSREGRIIYAGKTEDLLWGIDWDNQSKNIITSSANGKINVWNNTARLLKSIP